MRVFFAVVFALFILVIGVTPPALTHDATPPCASGMVGVESSSAGCLDCHQKFHKLWASSFHGLAMRFYSDDFAKASLSPMKRKMSIGNALYQAMTGPGQGWVDEMDDGKLHRYTIAYVLGGKDVFYFLTPMARGRLQTLPLAYDVLRREWFDMADSGVRHFTHESSRALDWKDRAYSFNTGCRGCHASQFSSSYDPDTDAYLTTWTEPGINCETCHGPGREHVAVCRNAPKGQIPIDLKIIRGGRKFTHEQQNAQCASCHAKAAALSPVMEPGQRFSDHFDLVTYENSDYYPDGRDLGENYTYTSWLRSPCVKSGELDCMHCHTSSGRYRFADPARANQACAACHAERVAEAPAHTRHPAGSPGNNCVSCHMPTTSFARIRRSDHSMLPPTPATTMDHSSPNACNICHRDKDAAWADRQVRAWHQHDYQAPVIQQAALVLAARQGDWRRLPQLLAYLDSDTADPIVSASILRLLANCPRAEKESAIAKAAKSASPLVRAAAADAMATGASPDAIGILTALTSDEYRLVRIRAAAALAQTATPAVGPSWSDNDNVRAATAEYLAILRARPDLWSSQYSLGNYFLECGDPAQAVACYEKAMRLSPSSVPPLVNISIAYARLGDPEKARDALREALTLQPDNAAANCNLGLLEAQIGDRTQAEKHLRAALRADPNMARAAYNLGVLIMASHPQEAIELCRRAARQRPDIPVYAYSLAYCLAGTGDQTGAVEVLTDLLRRHPGHQDASRLLTMIKKTRP